MAATSEVASVTIMGEELLEAKIVAEGRKGRISVNGGKIPEAELEGFS